MSDSIYLLEWGDINTTLKKVKQSHNKILKNKPHQIKCNNKQLLEKCVSCIHNGLLVIPKSSEIFKYWVMKDHPILCIWYGDTSLNTTQIFACTMDNKQQYSIKWISVNRHWLQLIPCDSGYMIDVATKSNDIHTVECKAVTDKDIETIRFTFPEQLFKLGYVPYAKQTDILPYEGKPSHGTYIRKQAPPIKYELYKISEPRKHHIKFVSTTSGAPYTIYMEQYDQILGLMRDGMLCIKRIYNFHNYCGSYTAGCPCLNFNELEQCGASDEDFVDKMLNYDPPPPDAEPEPEPEPERSNI